MGTGSLCKKYSTNAINILYIYIYIYIYNALILGSVFTLTKQPTNYWFLRDKFVF
jgi:hypothetical protein